MMIISVHTVTTPFGEFLVTALPDSLQARLASSRITRGGMPDRRFTASRTLWAEITEWAEKKWRAG